MFKNSDKKSGVVASTKSFFDRERPAELVSVCRPLSPADSEFLKGKVKELAGYSDVRAFPHLFTEVLGGSLLRKIYADLAMSKENTIKTHEGFNSMLGKLCMTNNFDQDPMLAEFGKFMTISNNGRRSRGMYVVLAGMKSQSDAKERIRAERENFIKDLAGHADGYVEDVGSFVPRLSIGFSFNTEDVENFVSACNEDEELLAHRYLLGGPKPV